MTGKRGKARQGEGSYEVLPDGRVRWRVHVTTPSGDKRHPSGTERNMTEARRAVARVRRDAEQWKLPADRRLTVAQVVGEYIAAREGAGAIKPRTARNYREALRRYIAPSLGALRAAAVGPQELRRFYTGLQEAGIGNEERRRVHNLLHAAYRLAVEEGSLSTNPAKLARPAMTPKEGAALPALTPSEAERFYAVARADRSGWHLAFMLSQGLRPGECLGLKWEHVTFTPEGAVVKIEETRSVGQGEVYESTPKTERGRRTLYVTGDAAQLLRDCRAQIEKEAGARLRYRGKEYERTGYVFVTRRGTPYRTDNLARPLERLCKEAGVKRVTPYGMRHTHISVQAARGVSLEVLSAHVGHAQASTTSKFYRHVFPEEMSGLTYDPTPSAARTLRPGLGGVFAKGLQKVDPTPGGSVGSKRKNRV